MMQKYAKFKKDIYNHTDIVNPKLIWMKNKEYLIDFEDDNVYMFKGKNLGIAKNYEGELFDIIEKEE